MSWFTVLALACVLIAPAWTSVVVLTKHGFIKGIQETISYEGQKQAIYKFLGVPYAEKPIGTLRFKRPQPLKKWSHNVYNATYFRPVCIQNLRHYKNSIKLAWPDFNKEKGVDEDCLYLNIYTPTTILGKRYPVMVYIHGGSFVAGTPVRDVSPGEFIPMGGVILVTVQYRLGVLGFFSTGTPEAPGNVGLLDQVQALEWVQQNIASFGGDRNKVTVLGESAGGASVTFLYLTPLSKGLFHRAIAISGVDFCPFAIKSKKEVLNLSANVAKSLACSSGSSSAMLRCLRSVPFSVLMSEDVQGLTPFVDSYFLPDDPKKMRKEGRFHKLPLMTGFVSHEGSFILNGRQPEYSREGFIKYVKGFIQRNYPNIQTFASDAVQFQYTPWIDVNDAKKIRKKLVEMLTDFFIIAPTHDMLTLHSKSDSLSYLFEFNHRSKLKNTTIHPEWMGVVHGDTTPYKFGAPLLNTNTLEQFDSDDKKISDMLVQLYLNFAKFGDPTPTPVYGVTWNAYNSSNKAYLKINKKPRMEINYHPARMAFWNEYFPKFIPSNPSRPSPGILGTRSSAKRLKSSALSYIMLLSYTLLWNLK